MLPVQYTWMDHTKCWMCSYAPAEYINTHSGKYFCYTCAHKIGIGFVKVKAN